MINFNRLYGRFLFLAFAVALMGVIGALFGLKDKADLIWIGYWFGLTTTIFMNGEAIETAREQGRKIATLKWRTTYWLSVLGLGAVAFGLTVALS